MHYHLASSYYSFFFYIYIYFTGSQFTREPTKRTRFKCDEFSKKKEMFVLTYIRMCVRLCVYIYACATTRRECSWYPYLLSVACSQFFEFFFIFFSFLFFFFFSLFVCYFIVASFFFYFPRCVIIISLNAQLTSYSELQLFTNLVK